MKEGRPQQVLERRACPHLTHEKFLPSARHSVYIPRMPHPPAPPLARTSAALSAVAAARPEPRSLLALILALLLRLFARKQAPWSLLEDDSLYDHVFLYDAREHAVTDFDAHAICGANPYAMARQSG
jgi:hypothetical protein